MFLENVAFWHLILRVAFAAVFALFGFRLFIFSLSFEFDVQLEDSFVVQAFYMYSVYNLVFCIKRFIMFLI